MCVHTDDQWGQSLCGGLLGAGCWVCEGVGHGVCGAGGCRSVWVAMVLGAALLGALTHTAEPPWGAADHPPVSTTTTLALGTGQGLQGPGQQGARHSSEGCQGPRSPVLGPWPWLLQPAPPALPGGHCKVPPASWEGGMPPAQSVQEEDLTPPEDWDVHYHLNPEPWRFRLL